MKKLTLLFAGTLYACILAAQPSFQTSLEAGVSLPLNSNDVNATHAGKAIHFGNHLDYSFGNGAVRFGLGAYIGYINSISTDDKYKVIGEAIAEKYHFAGSQLTFDAASFKSTQILLGPVASFGSAKCNINIWAKGGYGLNEPSRYAVLYKANGAVNNIYINQGGENKNGLAYNAGIGIRYALSAYAGLQLSAGYFSTQTDQVNYNFDREKGTTPLYYTASNQFIQASAGVHFTIGNPDKKSKTTDNRLHAAAGDTGNPVARPLKIKTKSNIKNDRLADTAGNNGDDNPDNDSLFFSPEKVELRSQVPGMATVQLQAVDNYLTGFVYQTQTGTVISQCGSNAMPGDPVPGIDVRLRRMGESANDAVAARTNRDGSFSFSNITPGNYSAAAGNNKMDITVNGNKENDFTILDINSGSCGAVKENYIISAGDKTYVEIISAADAGNMTTARKHVANIKYSDLSSIVAHDAATGMATGKRMHQPFRVTNTAFDVNMYNIVTSDGKLYAEVTASREAGSGMATGRSTLVTGDVDGDGITDYTVSPRDAAPGLSTGRRMHKPMVITKELNVTDEDAAEIVSPRDAASGLPTGKRMHQPMVITKELAVTEDGDEVEVYRIVHRDLATRSNLATDDQGTEKMAITEQGVPGTRQHKKGIITGKDNDNGMFTENNAAEEVVKNPLYEASGGGGVNPMFESRNALHVTGGNGKSHDIFIPSNMVIQQGSSAGIVQNARYEISPVRWMAPESISRETAGKGISEKGIKRNAATQSDNQAARKGWDGSVKGSGKISEEGTDNSVAAKGIQEKGIKKSEIVAGSAVIKNISRMHCADGTCTLEATVEVDGATYEAVIQGSMKTKRDTVKNSIR